MSLVNQVLRDLQHRRSEHPDTSGLLAAEADSAFGRRPRSRWLPLGIAAITVGLVAFAAHQFFVREPAAPLTPPAQIAEQPKNVDTAPLRRDAEVAAPTEPEVVESVPVAIDPEASQVTPEIVDVVTEPEAAVEVAPEPVSAAPRRRELNPTPSLTRTLVTTTPWQRADEAYNHGVRALSEGRRDTAESQFRTALGHDGSHAEARLALANLLAGQGALRDAEAQLQQGLRIAPDAAPLAERYARLLFERGDLAGAIGVLADAAPPLTTNPDYHALLAALQQRAGNHAAAADIYAALVELKSDQALWWVGLGISLEAEQRSEAALHAYRQAARDSRVTTAVAEFVRERIAVLEP